MRRIRLTATLTAALLLLAGCGAQQGANEAISSTRSPSKPSSSPNQRPASEGTS